VKKFLIHIALFTTIIIGVLTALGVVITAGLRKTRIENFSEWNDIFDSKINADLIVTGSSRAWSNVSPKIIDSTLNLNSYNLGLDGAHFDIQFSRTKLT
jgi:hypothetical protein